MAMCKSIDFNAVYGDRAKEIIQLYKKLVKEYDTKLLRCRKLVFSMRQNSNDNSGDIVDNTTAKEERDKAATEIERLQEDIKDIEEITLFLVEGWDCACKKCGNPIPLERIEVAHSCLCVDCANAQ